MKKWFLLAAAAVLTLPVLAQQQEAFPSYIRVTGRSEMEVAPDEFYLSIVIDEKDSKGKVSVESQQRQMIDALRRLGIDVDRQLKVANLSSEFFKRRNSVATAKYQLRLATAEQVTRVYDVLDRLGISNISIQKMSHSKLDELKQQVRVEAIRDAQRNARILAQAIGQQIGTCFCIENPAEYYSPYGDYNYDGIVVGYGNSRTGRVMSADEMPRPDFKPIVLRQTVVASFVLE